MLRFFAFKFPFTVPFKTASGTITHRQGILMVLTLDGITAFGEVAPLPGFSPDRLEQILPILFNNRQYLVQGFKNGQIREIVEMLHSIHQFPALSFGLDMLVADFQAKSQQKPLLDFLFNQHHGSPKANAVLGLQSPKRTIQMAEQLISKGFDTLKVKVGNDFDTELKTLSILRDHYPTLKLRIDANQAWTPQEALRNLSLLEPLNLEYCEQPIAADHPEELKWVNERSPIAIAADEAAQTPDRALQLIQANACSVLILKPTLFGRFNNLTVTKEQAASHSIEVVLTTAFDATPGRITTAVLASGLGSGKYAHGLATGSYLKEPNHYSEEIIRGKFPLPDEHGLGFPIDLSYYKEIT